MNAKILVHNSEGSTLVIIAVLSFIISIVSYIAVSQSSQLNSHSQRIRKKVEAYAFLQKLSFDLQDPNICTLSLNGIPINNPLNFAIKEPETNSRWMAQGATVNGLWQVDLLEPRFFLGSLNLYELDINISISAVADSAVQAKTSIIGLKVFTNSSGQITACAD